MLLYVWVSTSRIHLFPSCSEFVQVYTGLDSELSDVKDMLTPVAANDKPMITVIKLAEGKEPSKSYRCYEVQLKPGTDKKQLLAELNDNKTVQRVAIVKREEDREGVDAAICTILWPADSMHAWTVIVWSYVYSAFNSFKRIDTFADIVLLYYIAWVYYICSCQITLLSSTDSFIP